MKEKIYLTNNLCFTAEQAEHCFKDKVSILNYEILTANICQPLLATMIEGFTEKNGVLFFKIGDEMISVTHNLNNPRFSN
jgi:hypothetical protein